MPGPFRSLIAAALSVAAVTVAVTGAAAPAGAAAPSGYTLENAHLIGETPAVLHVYVDRSAAHHTVLARASRGIVAELRRFGLRIVDAGYGRPAQADGRIQVSEGNYGCSIKGVGRTDAVTVPYFRTAAGADVFMSHSAITVCPSFAGSASRTSITSALKHEFGHALGLGHTSTTYQGRHQIMYPGLQRNVTDYGSGDVRGLKALAAGAARVRTEMPPIGKQASRFVNGHIVFSGWSYLALYPNRLVTITVTDNGRTVYSSASMVRSASLNRQRHVSGSHAFTLTRPWLGGRHTYCLSATSSLDRRATTSLGCVTWQG